MKKLLLIFGLCSPLFFAACGDSSTDGDEPKETPVVVEDDGKEGLKEYHLDTAGFDLSIWLPTLENTAPMINFDENLGVLKIELGTRFKMEIFEEEPDFELLKSDLETDFTFTNTILSEAPELITYEARAKDMDKRLHHFYGSKTINGVAYIVRDDPMTTFPKSSIDNMVKSFETLEGL